MVAGTCASCLCTLTTSDEPIVMALGQQWHCDCFRCSVCDAHLHNWYFEREGLLYCRDDYYARFGDACQQCTAVITGPVMVAGEHKFHPECFCCASCGAFVGEGEAYALVERSKLYCGQCYGRRQVAAGGIGGGGAATGGGCGTITTAVAPAPNRTKPMHSIRLVEIPKDATTGLRVDGGGSIDGGCPTVRITDYICKFYGRVGKYAFSLLTSVAGRCCGTYRIDVNLTNVHIGDRILEVNGTPVSDSSVEQIDKLIRSNEKMLQLTVEHDPIQVCRSCSQADIQRACSATTLALPLTTSASSVEVGGRERLYKAVDEKSSSKARKMRKTAAMTAAVPTTKNNISSITSSTSSSPSPFGLKEKERCSSLSKLLDEQHTAQQHSDHPQLYDLSRTQSCRVEHKPQRIFRASDLVIGEKLGEGFFGKVYKVTHRLSGEVMVLKELHRADEEAQRNFLKEVAVLRLLDHRHVLKFIGVLNKDKKLHMVTEYVAGGCLKELIHDSNASLDWSQRVRFARDIACGMSYLHSMNIIHRDLNSMNCLVRADRSVIVADFGLARTVDSPRQQPPPPPPSLQSQPSQPQQQQQPSQTSIDNNISGSSALSAGGTLRRSKSRQRRQRYTVVGNPYWMAPEMMKGLRYDEKVDVFSFGIMVCEIIGRVEADPDFMPRNSDFSLNQQEFREKFCTQCPEAFVKVAFLCCDLNPDMRPSFDTLYVWLERLIEHIVVAGDQPPPVVLIQEMDNFQDNSYFSSEDAISPTSQRSLDNLDVVGQPQQQQPQQQQPQQQQQQQEQLLQVELDLELEETEKGKENMTIRPQDVPKSPHLGKDFSPTGERLRDSMRARRRQRFLGAQQQRRGLTPETTSAERALRNALKKCRPFGEKGFLVEMRPGAELQLHDVRDLNNYSDVDSSCDTSLNYHEVNATIESTPAPSEYPAMPHPSSQTPPLTLPLPLEKEGAVGGENDVSPTPHRSAFQDMRTRLHQCRSKFEHLHQANQRNFSQAQHSMRTFFKTPPVALKMFQRLEKEARNGQNQTATSSVASGSTASARRINQTPIFERRFVASPTSTSQKGLKHTESLEDLMPSSLDLGAKRSKANVAPIVIHVNSEHHSPQPPPPLPPRTPAVAPSPPPPLPLPSSTSTSRSPPAMTNKKHKLSSSATLTSSMRPAVAAGVVKSKTSPSQPPQSASTTTKMINHPAIDCCASVSASATRRRPISPTKHLAQRHTAATAQRVTNLVAQPTRTTRMNILSPEKVHRLSAKLTDQKQKLRDESSTTGGGQTSVGIGGGVGVGGSVERRRRGAAPSPQPLMRTQFNTRC